MTRQELFKKHLDNIEYGKAIKNIKEGIIGTGYSLNDSLSYDCIIVSHAIAGAFVWSSTEEGSVYWDNINFRIINKENSHQ